MRLLMLEHRETLEEGSAWGSPHLFDEQYGEHDISSEENSASLRGENTTLKKENNTLKQENITLKQENERLNQLLAEQTMVEVINVDTSMDELQEAPPQYRARGGVENKKRKSVEALLDEKNRGVKVKIEVSEKIVVDRGETES